MGEILRWGPNLLYEEEATNLPQVCFRYPSRLESAGLLIMAVVGGIGLVSWYYLDRGNGLWLGVSGAFTLFMATSAVMAIWDQQLVPVDRHTRESTYYRRNPFLSLQEIVQAVHLREVRIADQDDSENSDSERKYWLHLVRMNGDRVLLGGGTWKESVHLGRRLSELLRRPLELPTSDNLRST